MGIRTANAHFDVHRCCYLIWLLRILYLHREMSNFAILPVRTQDFPTSECICRKE